MLKHLFLTASLILNVFAATSFAKASDDALVFPQNKASLDSTALSLLLREDPMADLTTEDTYNKWNNIRNEVKEVLQAIYPNSPSNREAFFEYPPMEYGVLYFKAKGNLAVFLEKLAPASSKITSIDPNTFSSGNVLFDTFVKKWQISAIKNDKFAMKLHFSVLINPYLVASSKVMLDQIEWMEPNGFNSIGGGNNLVRMNVHPAVYRAEIGWGDCPAGCISRHQFYVEVSSDFNGTYSTKILAESGEPLDTK